MDQDPAVQLFGTEDFDLYATLGLDKTATVDQIKSAYRKLALKFHPDKQVCATEEDKAAAATKFQQAGYSYSILSDDARRKRYDDTGRTDASLFPDDAKAWQAYFEELWTGQVNAATIDDFFDKYEGPSGMFRGLAWLCLHTEHALTVACVNPLFCPVHLLAHTYTQALKKKRTTLSTATKSSTATLSKCWNTA